LWPLFGSAPSASEETLLSLVYAKSAGSGHPIPEDTNMKSPTVPENEHYSPSHKLKIPGGKLLLFDLDNMVPERVWPSDYNPSLLDSMNHLMFSACRRCGRKNHLSYSNIKLSCGHMICRSCVRRKFLKSVQNTKDMPPCCCHRVLPLGLGNMCGLDLDFKADWNQKATEFNKALVRQQESGIST